MNRKNQHPPEPLAPRGDLVPDTDILFPALSPELVDGKADDAGGVVDPRTEGNSPEVVSAPFAGG
jgi:hypothetical protein